MTSEPSVSVFGVRSSGWFQRGLCAKALRRAVLANCVALGTLGTPTLHAAFTDVAARAGLHVVPPPEFEEPFPAGLDRYTSGYASCAVDLDRDGWTDLIVSQNPRRCLVFMNNRDGTFREEGVLRGFESAVDIGGIAAGDFTNSGRTDVFMVPRNGPRYFLYINDGSGRFTEQAIPRGADSTVPGEPHRGQSIGLVDFDRDGFLDVHVTEWGVLVAGNDARYSVLLRNRGTAQPGHFENVTAAAGVRQPYFGTVIHGYSSAWADFDEDGYPDLSLVNDFGKSQFWWNNGNGTFTEGRQSARVGTDQNGMGVAVADFDRDGRLDFLVSSFDFGTGETVRIPFGGNRLYRNLGNRQFEEVASRLGVLDSSWGWGAAFLDADNDARLDLMVTNGYFFESPPYTGPRAFPIRNAKNDRTLFYLQNEIGFYEAGEAWGVTDRTYGRGMSVLDFDNDGDEDVLITTLYGNPILYRSDPPASAAGNRWLRLSFRGTASNRDGYGTTVRVTAGGVTQTAVYAPTNAYLGQREPFLHFGLGPNAVVERIAVTWPNGATQTLTGVASNQIVPLVEPSSTTNVAPRFTQQPVGGTFQKGDHVTLTVAATGVPAPVYSWLRDGQLIPGKTSATLVLERIHPADAGRYQAVANSPAGVVQSVAVDVNVTATLASRSIARWWNEALLDGIRRDRPNPPVHGRNLYHLSAALWDAFWAYEPDAWRSVQPAFRRETGRWGAGPGEREAAQQRAMSHAAYRVLTTRFAASPGAARTLLGARWLMELAGFDATDTTTTGDSPAAIGNRIGEAILAATRNDGANEAGRYADATGYKPANQPMIVGIPGTVMADPNRWQPLFLDFSVTQNGIIEPSGLQSFVGVNGGFITTFALVKTGPSTFYLDPGPPPQLGGAGSETYISDAVEVIRSSSLLDPATAPKIDVSPGGRLNNPLGTDKGTGYPRNPATGKPYAANLVNQADYFRVLAEYWADGPDSETPPGHWNVIFNQVNDHPAARRLLGGQGPELSRLEWDVRGYFALNGSLHDAACAAWGLKRQYDGVRPISMIRHLAGLGQSSDPSAKRYNQNGLPLIPDLIELTTPQSVAPGGRHAVVSQRRDTVEAVVDKIVVRAWRGNPADPLRQVGGVDWVLAESWVPYQMKTFVTPAFPGYVSGHSTFSRTAAEVMTLLFGSPFYPGGISEKRFPRDTFLLFERGPTEELALQWATYYDAADQAGQSRIYGGIHIPTDDFAGRRLGARLGLEGFLKAQMMRTEAAGAAAGLVNVSTRGLSGAGERVLIAGFVLSDGASQNALVRSAGQALAAFGLPAERCAPNPRLEVFRSGGGFLAANDDWVRDPTAAQIRAAAAARGAFALPESGQDAATLVNVAEGAFTVNAASGAASATDLPIQLVEVYGERLRNVSTRGFVRANEGALIAGFSLATVEPAMVLVRGLGPVLGGFGVREPLADPVLRIHRIGAGGSTELIAENDDWDKDAKASLAAVTAIKLGAIPLSSGARDAAVFLQLPAGNYTVSLQGAGASTGAEGVGLVEVYLVR